jgi:hypothetical protein
MWAARGDGGGTWVKQLTDTEVITGSGLAKRTLIALDSV